MPGTPAPEPQIRSRSYKIACDRNTITRLHTETLKPFHDNHLTAACTNQIQDSGGSAVTGILSQTLMYLTETLT